MSDPIVYAHTDYLRDPGPSVDPQTVQAHIERSLAREAVNKDVREAFREAQANRQASKGLARLAGLTAAFVG